LLQIDLDKKQERWWEAVLTSEPKINVRKIDASRPMTDLNDEAQAKIEEMMLFFIQIYLQKILSSYSSLINIII
jgi:hypothetical protein